MPIYEYRCKKCDERFELLVGPSTKPACPKCASKKLEKLVSGFAAHSKSAAPCGAKNADACAHAHSSGCGCGCRGR